MTSNRLLTRLRTSLLWMVAALCLLSAPARGEGGDALTVGVPVDRCPMFYRSADTNEIIGIGVDLMRTAAEAAGYTVDFREIGEGSLKEALDNPDYDVIMPFGSAIGSAAGRISVVSDNFIQTPFTLVTKGRRSIPALDALHVGMLKSLAAGAETVRQLYPGMEITLYASMPECVKALRSGAVDALLHNSYVWSYVLQKPSYVDLVVQPSAVFSMDFRAAAPDTPEGQAVIARLNQGIATLTDTRRQAIILDHTSRRLYQYDFFDYLYQYGMFLLAVSLFIGALIFSSVQRIRSVRRWHEQKMQEMLEYDPLTGLLNMNGFRKRVESLLRAHPDRPYFLSYNNIRDFKFINDSLGREAGDALLQFWAEHSRETLSDEEAIGRIEADHFAVLRLITGEETMREDEKDVLDPVHTFFIDQGKDSRVQICSGMHRGNHQLPARRHQGRGHTGPLPASGELRDGRDHRRGGPVPVGSHQAGLAVSLRFHIHAGGGRTHIRPGLLRLGDGLQGPAPLERGRGPKSRFRERIPGRHPGGPGHPRPLPEAD